jgi:sensor c-di-GMP phosphodiesterase-like protein
MGRFFLRNELTIIVIVALLPEIFMLGFSFLWIETSIEHEMAFLADATARRTDNILKITQSNLEQLADKTHAHCDQAAIDFMREKVFKVMYIRETGIINQNKLMCNDVKMFEPPVDITEPEHRRLPDRDGDIALVPPVSTLQGSKSVLVNYRVSTDKYVNALIDPDIFHEFHEYVRLGEVSGVFLVREDGKTIVSFGSMSEKDLPPVALNSEHNRLYHGNLFAVYKSANFPVYAVVSASPAFIIQHWQRHAMVITALAGFVSLALVLILKRNRHRFNLLQGELWQAIEKNEFFIVYQPIMDMIKQRCVGAEVLIRWQHPGQGLVMPLLFIPVAERTGMIRYITRWIIKQVDHELGDYMRTNSDIHVGINLSPADLTADNQDSVGNDLLLKKIPAKQVIYEITEHSMIPAQAVNVLETMTTLRNTGAKLALDDFGTGYSSLSYVQRFPLDYLKIDKAFVDGILDETSNTGLIEHIMSIASSLCFGLIAEGIEHDYQMSYLKTHGVIFGQGNYFSKPLPYSEFISFLQATNQAE